MTNKFSLQSDQILASSSKDIPDDLRTLYRTQKETASILACGIKEVCSEFLKIKVLPPLDQNSLLSEFLSISEALESFFTRMEPP